MVFNKAKDSYDDFYFESERAALAKKKKKLFLNLQSENVPCSQKIGRRKNNLTESRI